MLHGNRVLVTTWPDSSSTKSTKKPPQHFSVVWNSRHRNGFTNQHEIHQFLRKLNVFPLTNKLTQQANGRWEDGPRTPHLGGCLNLTFFLCFKEGFDGKWLLEIIISGQSYPKILPKMENPTQNGSLYYHKSLPWKVFGHFGNWIFHYFSRPFGYLPYTRWRLSWTNPFENMRK